MTSKKIVIALGGNALGNTPQEQFKSVQLPAKKIAELAKLGHKIIVGHGNGPQVGLIFNTFSETHRLNQATPLMPLPESGAMSQGYIGYHLVTAITNEYIKNKIKSDVVYFLTQTLVDAKDLAFKKPSKPIGPFYKNLEDAKKQNPGSAIIEDAGRGYRRVVASPLPINFLGINTIKKAINNGSTVIVGGGGGIPVINKTNKIAGVDGVIDKDFALAKMAELIGTDIFIILTAVSHVAINYKTPNEKKLTNVSIKELKTYLDQNQFAAGSMKPKVEACINFIGKNKNKIAYIGQLNDLSKIIVNKTGTKIHL